MLNCDLIISPVILTLFIVFLELIKYAFPEGGKAENETGSHLHGTCLQLFIFNKELVSASTDAHT